MEQFYKVKIGKCERMLPLINSGKISYYSFNMMGDAELNIESAKVLATSLKDIDVIVTVESKAIALAQEVASILKHPKYVIVRKSAKSYMVNPISASGNTIISGGANYYLDGNDVEYLKNKRIAVVDDVVSTCGTIDAIYRLLAKAKLTINKIACVLCEGKVTTEFKGFPVISCGFIPLMESNNDW